MPTSRKSSRKSRSRQTPARVDPRIPGGRYLCGYWSREYIVIAIWMTLDRTLWLAVEWQPTTTASHPRASSQWRDDPPHVTVHCTAWDPRRDVIISQPDDVPDDRKD